MADYSVAKYAYSKWAPDSVQGRFKGSGMRGMGSVFNMLCPGHGDSKQVTAATAYRAMRS